MSACTKIVRVGIQVAVRAKDFKRTCCAERIFCVAVP